MKDFRESNDIFVGDRVNVPCQITALTGTNGVSLVTIHPASGSTTGTVLTLINKQIVGN